ncbi:MAG: hypothetical protein CL885_04135 [Dehalococcoidia bacterium]|nr:hypothetical protein [Dehalococcoidia bacterium]|tara:strand:+ start:883 stop:1098 length:216 start_codon:yes stop_codon:yes gene_type:complete
MRKFEKVTLIISADEYSTSQNHKPVDILTEVINDSLDVEVIEIIDNEEMELVLCSDNPSIQAPPFKEKECS